MSWSDHALITMRFCGTAIHYREGGPIILVCPWQLMHLGGFQRELEIVSSGLLHVLHHLMTTWSPLEISRQQRLWIGSQLCDLVDPITPYGL